MDISKLKRDPIKAKANLKQVGKTIVTTKDCKIQFPVEYANNNLAILGTETQSLGIFPIIFEDSYYTLNNTLAPFRMYPDKIEIVKINGADYNELSFKAGDTLFQNTDLVKVDKMVYFVYNYFIAKGNIPWYLELFDVANIFATSIEHAGVNLGNKTTMDIIIMTMARDSKDIYKLYKHVMNDIKDVDTNPPMLISFDSVIFNTSDTTSKLNGSYFNEAINAALVNKSERVEMIEELLRT